MLNLAVQGRIGGIEAQLDGMRGIDELHNTIGKAEALVSGDEKRHSFALVARLLAKGGCIRAVRLRWQLIPAG